MTNLILVVSSLSPPNSPIGPKHLVNVADLVFKPQKDIERGIFINGQPDPHVRASHPFSFF